MRYHTMIRAAHEVEGAGGRRARGQRGQREHQEGEAWASSSSGRGRCSNGRAAREAAEKVPEGCWRGVGGGQEGYAGVGERMGPGLCVCGGVAPRNFCGGELLGARGRGGAAYWLLWQEGEHLCDVELGEYDGERLRRLHL